MNRLLAYLGEAIASLWRNRVRSILTMLGMIIGSASIITVFGISKAATSGIASAFKSFGVQPVVVFVDNSQNYPQTAQIYYRDLATVASDLGADSKEVLPVWFRTYEIAANGKTDHIGIQQDGSYHTDGLTMAEGSEFTAEEVDAAEHVVVVTQDVAHEFFGDAPALGQYLRINGTRFKISGVFANINGSFFNSIAGSSTVIVPYTTYHDVFSQNDPMDFILVYPTDALAGDAVGKETIASLQHVHGSRALYKSQNQQSQLQTFDNVLSIVGLGLSVIGSVALVVAGIGIMNIMLVSVTERTREIGIRKSIGASRRDIMTQFLLEAILLSTLGGLIGMGFGIIATVGAASLLSKTLGTLLIPYLTIVGIALTFSFTVGTIFGTYPALRAAQMDPIEALRS